MTGKCKFCNKENKLVESHIIPKAFFKYIKKSNEPLKILTNVRGEFTKRSEKGVYDEFICLDCEKRFEKYDDYAAKILIHGRHKFIPLYEKGRIIAFQLEKYNYELLKLFFISVLWKASVSTHSFYSRVSIGPYEKCAKSMIERNDPGTENDFSTLLSCWQITQKKRFLLQSMMDPFKEKWDAINSYRFYFADIVCSIKTDKRNFIKPMSEIMLKPDRPLYLICRNLENSSDYRAMLSVARGSYN